ncbi:MAG TPA: type II toxin-antitoxin system VapC family toxin [Bryobacteraceae bacterium]|nr:type II toxin-antitoxin system VapC family toxin [Bryobacteraceae bacterium]
MTVCVDASALLAIALQEDDADSVTAQIAQGEFRIMSSVNYWEALVRMRKHSAESGVEVLEGIRIRLEIEVVPSTAEHARLAAATFARFGKNHQAKLNLGDCFAYATARANDAKLIFKGNDFPLTDILA